MKIAWVSLPLLLAASVGLGRLAAAHSPCPDTDGRPHGRELADWAELYLRWGLGELRLPVDHHGNSVLGDTVFLPIPSTPSDGTPGHVDVTLDRRQAFTLPLFALFGTTYADGAPPDPFEPVSIFETLLIDFRIDGVAVIDGDNALDYFRRFEIHPPIPYDAAPATSVIWYEGVSIFQHSLGPGEHVLALDAVNTEPAFGQFFEYHNTWTLTVR